MTDPVAAPTVNHPFRYVNGCGLSNRTIFTPDGGVTIHIGCSVYTPDDARDAIASKYADRPELMVKYLSAVDRLVNDDAPFDLEQFNWSEHSDDLVKYAPQHFDPERYNWANDSYELIEYAPQYFDPYRFNWARASGFLVRHAPQYFDPERYNWLGHSGDLVQCAPHLFDPERFNWDNAAWAIIKHAPHLIDPDRYAIPEVSKNLQVHGSKGLSRCWNAIKKLLNHKGAQNDRRTE